jgi:hypothetical protein
LSNAHPYKIKDLGGTQVLDFIFGSSVGVLIIKNQMWNPALLGQDSNPATIQAGFRLSPQPAYNCLGFEARHSIPFPSRASFFRQSSAVAIAMAGQAASTSEIACAATGRSPPREFLVSLTLIEK